MGAIVELLLSGFWAFWMGALNAVRPSASKSIVRAYLAKTQGRPRDVLILTLAVTAAQTGGVVVLGLLSASVVAVLLPKHAQIWLQAASGAVVAGIGVWMLFGKAPSGQKQIGPAEGGGETEHEPPPVPKLSAGLVALGASGGMVPSPQALAVFMAAVGRGELAVGVALVLAYSLGMASVLALSGLAALRATEMVSSWFSHGQAGRGVLSVISALAVCAMGVALVVIALRGYQPRPG